MTGSELARKLGVTRQAISKLVRRGMPLDSVEAAQKWRAVHAPPRKSIAVAEADKGKTPFEDAMTRAERARACEEYFYQTLQKAAEAHDIRLTAKVGKDFLQAAKRAAEAEQIAIAAGIQGRDFISTREIVEHFDDIIRPWLHRCHMAETNPACRWYETVEGCAESARKTIALFFTRLSPRCIFDPNENTETPKA